MVFQFVAIGTVDRSVLARLTFTVIRWTTRVIWIGSGFCHHNHLSIALRAIMRCFVVLFACGLKTFYVSTAFARLFRRTPKVVWSRNLHKNFSWVLAFHRWCDCRVWACCKARSWTSICRIVLWWYVVFISSLYFLGQNLSDLQNHAKPSIIMNIKDWSW